MKMYDIEALRDKPDIYKKLKVIYTPVDAKLIRRIKSEWKENPKEGASILISMFHHYKTKHGKPIQWFIRTAELFEVTGGFKGGKHPRSVPSLWSAFELDLETIINKIQAWPEDMTAEKYIRLNYDRITKMKLTMPVSQVYETLSFETGGMLTAGTLQKEFTIVNKEIVFENRTNRDK